LTYGAPQMLTALSTYLLVMLLSVIAVSGTQLHIVPSVYFFKLTYFELTEIFVMHLVVGYIIN